MALKALLPEDEEVIEAVAGPATDVDGLEVVAARKPKPEMVTAEAALIPDPVLNSSVPSPTLSMGAPQVSQVPNLNYNNSMAQDALNESMKTNKPMGGGANPGIYGLLPERMQQGTLRNVLGAIGDAFLVQSGNAATYAPRMDRQRIAQAMAGYDPEDPASVQAAIQRIAATGAPDALKIATDLQDDFNDTQLRKQSAEDTRVYRQGQAESRQDSALQRMVPYIGGMVQTAKTKEAYAAAYARADAIAKRIGPNYSAADFGLIDPSDWTPEAAAGAGLTSNNIITSSDRAAGRQTSERNTDVNAASRITAAGIGANSRIKAAQMSAGRETTAIMMADLIEKRNSGAQLTPAEQEFWNKQTTLPAGRSSGRKIPAGLTTKGGPAPKPTARATPQYREGQIYVDANGNKAKRINGKWVPQ